MPCLKAQQICCRAGGLPPSTSAPWPPPNSTDHLLKHEAGGFLLLLSFVVVIVFCQSTDHLNCLLGQSLFPATDARDMLRQGHQRPGSRDREMKESLLPLSDLLSIEPPSEKPKTAATCESGMCVSSKPPPVSRPCPSVPVHQLPSPAWIQPVTGSSLPQWGSGHHPQLCPHTSPVGVTGTITESSF